MSDDAVRDLARLNGVSPTWTDHTGQTRDVSPDDLRRILGKLGAPCASDADIADSRARAIATAAARDLPPLIAMRVGERLRAPVDHLDARHGRLVFEDGETRDFDLEDDHDGYVRGLAVERAGYHQLHIGERACTLAVAPPRCLTVADITGGARAWGLSAQVYALRTAGDGGVGTFSGVEALAFAAAARGADALALSPTHALFDADPHHYSPYSPSSRLWRNAAHADAASVFSPARIAAAIAASGVAEELAQLEALPLVDWPRAGAARARVLRAMFESFERHDLANHTDAAHDFAVFMNDGGQALTDHARFETLHAHHYARDRAMWDWRRWPAEHRDARSEAVAAFARDHARDVAYHVFLQWLAARSQAAAQAAARTAGMRIGLIADLAIGVNARGAQAWSRPGEMLDGLSVGAPPDPLAPRGQTWGLTTFAPHALRATGYEAFIATMRNMLRHAGGLRIDHVMGLARLWVTPDGEDASHGAYLTYPFETLLRLVALESHRARAVIIGEDLGTVPHGFRDRLTDAGLYGLRVALFERTHDRFLAPHDYTRDAVAMTSTHDTPTFAGWWRGADLKLREELDQFGPGQSFDSENGARAHERTMMWRAFEACGASVSAEPSLEHESVAVDAAVGFAARTRSMLAIIPVEDLIGAQAQINLPGTTDEHPNWRHRLDGDARRLLDAASSQSRIATMRRERKREL